MKPHISMPARVRARPFALGLAGVLLLGAGYASAAEPAARPPYAKPGECYARTVKPAVYGTQTRQVVDAEAWTETRVIPAVTERVVRQVVVTPERVDRTWHEAVYREDVHWVTRPGPKRLVQEPPRYQTVDEQVMVEAGRYEWQRSFQPIAQTAAYAPGQTLVYATGEVYCKVWIEPRYKLVQKTVLVSEGRAYEVEGPPIKEKVVDRVLVSEGGWTEHREAAVYRSETETRVVEAARTESIPHAARYRTVTDRVLISGEREEWVQIKCVEVAKPAPYGERG